MQALNQSTCSQHGRVTAIAANPSFILAPYRVRLLQHHAKMGKIGEDGGKLGEMGEGKMGLDWRNGGRCGRENGI